MPRPPKEVRPMKKVTTFLPEPVWRKAKILAMDRHTSLQQVMLAALQEYLKGAKPEPRG
jgi:hypothetical protein